MAHSGLWRTDNMTLGLHCGGTCSMHIWHLCMLWKYVWWSEAQRHSFLRYQALTDNIRAETTPCWCRDASLQTLESLKFASLRSLQWHEFVSRMISTYSCLNKTTIEQWSQMHYMKHQTCKSTTVCMSLIEHKWNRRFFQHSMISQTRQVS